MKFEIREMERCKLKIENTGIWFRSFKINDLDNQLVIRGFPKVDHSANIARIVLVDQLLN